MRTQQFLKEGANLISQKLPPDRTAARRLLDLSLEFRRWQLGLGDLSADFSAQADRAAVQEIAPYLTDDISDAGRICDLAMEIQDWVLGHRPKLSAVKN